MVNEINTMPGFTAHSMFPRMWAASGVPYPELVDHLITPRSGAPSACAEPSSPFTLFIAYWQGCWTAGRGR